MAANESALVRAGFAYYSPLDQWRHADGRFLSGDFVRNGYERPLTPELFARLLDKGEMSMPDGRVFRVGTLAAP